MTRLRTSVVIPVYNDAHGAMQAVRCLLGQTLPPDEIVVVDDGSTESTLQRVEEVAPTVRYVHKENGGPASARNLGVRVARGDLIAFIDSDCRPTPGWLEALVAAFDTPRVGGAGGRVLGLSGGLLSEYIDTRCMFAPGAAEDGSILYVVTANACFRRDALLAAGLFDERFRRAGGEDFELCQRVRSLGYALRYVSEALLFHEHRRTVWSLLRTVANYGEGHYLLGSIWPEHRLDHPLQRLLRASISLHAAARRTIRYTMAHGLMRGLAFGLLDYFYIPAFLLGYIRGAMRLERFKDAHSAR